MNEMQHPGNKIAKLKTHKEVLAFVVYFHILLRMNTLLLKEKEKEIFHQKFASGCDGLMF